MEPAPTVSPPCSPNSACAEGEGVESIVAAYLAKLIFPLSHEMMAKYKEDALPSHHFLALFLTPPPPPIGPPFAALNCASLSNTASAFCCNLSLNLVNSNQKGPGGDELWLCSPHHLGHPRVLGPSFSL